MSALTEALAALPADSLRPPPAPSDAVADLSLLGRAGAEQLAELWQRTDGGSCGPLELLGPGESRAELAKWRELVTSEEDDPLDDVVAPDWDASTSLQPTRVQGIYYAMGWIPVLREPHEANYLAVDLVPMPEGTPGQVISCGRDEDDKCVVAPDLAVALAGLARLIAQQPTFDARDLLNAARDGALF